MEQIDKDAIRQAKEAARNTFNSLPFETRKKLANGFDRLLEVELLLSKGDKLSLAEPKWYDYLYKDSTNFSVGDTIIITAKRIGN